MTRRGFLGLVGSLPFLGFLKGGESAEAKSSPVREAVGSAAYILNLNETTDPYAIVASYGPKMRDAMRRTRVSDTILVLHGRDVHRDWVRAGCPIPAPKGGAS